jgi:hypothetical protein
MNEDILEKVIEEIKKRGKKRRKKEDEDDGKISKPVQVIGSY